MDLLTYYYQKYQKADSNEERFDILLQFLSNDTFSNLTEYFQLDINEIEFWNQYNINDFFFTNEDDIEQCWHHLMKNYSNDDSN